MSVKRNATYDDLVALPDDRIAEIVSGDLYASPRPRIRHARVLSALGAKLFSVFDDGVRGAGGWWVLDEPELHLANDVLVPDIAAWKRERLPALPDTPAIEVVPDWVCEILSPATTELDREQNLPSSARHGVRWLWLIDPPLQRVEVYGQEAGRWSLLDTALAEEMLAAEPFASLSIELASLWPR
jgi:Uma2 family endonuclease